MEAATLARERALRAWGEPPAGGIVRITALGGLGQVGMNCLCIDQRDERLLIDCGITFPPSVHGIEHLEPPLGLLAGGTMRLVGLVLTHGHEDHIGAVPRLLASHAVPVWGPSHALELVRARLAEQPVQTAAPVGPPSGALGPIDPGERCAVGSFRIEAIRVAHSIAEAIALCIETDAGRIVHSGDFTIHGSGAHRAPTDLDRFAELGLEGVRLLCADSTNVELARPGPDEPSVAAALEAIVRQAPGRVVVGHFASNTHRLSSLAAIARSTDRALCLLGRSMERHLAVGLAMGQIELAPGQPISAALAREKLGRRLLVAASGTQAEPRGALRRLAAGEHSELTLEPGDTVVLSSRTIPGNERAVGQMLDAFWRRGVRVVTPAEEPALHASGHASGAELERLVELVRPEALLPVHGSRHQLERLAAIGRALGVRSSLALENGQPLLVAATGPLELGPALEVTPVPFGAQARVEDEVLAERRRLGRAGLVAVSVAQEPGDGWRAEVRAQGLRLADEERRAVARACLGILVADPALGTGRLALERRMARAAASLLRAAGRGRPAVEVTLVEPRASGSTEPPTG